MRAALIDLDSHDVLECDGKVRKGKCRQCGVCCIKPDGSQCDHLYFDAWHDEAQTQPIFACRLQFTKPWFCILFPLPGEKTPEGCGFWWEDKV